MPDALRLYLDTNILIKANEGARPERVLLEQMLMAGISRGSAQFVTSELTRSELLVRPYRDSNRLLADAYNSLFSANGWLQVLPVSADCLTLAAILRSAHSGVKLPDAIHLASGLIARCGIFLTGDLGITSIEDTRHPFGTPLDFGSLTVLRPDEPTLLSLIESLSA